MSSHERMSANVAESYHDQWMLFGDTSTVEFDFVGRPADEQRRLNDYKLWAIGRSGFAVAGKDVLEFGAGHGRFAMEFPDVASYLGVEISGKLVEVGQKRLERAGLAQRAKLTVGDCESFRGSPRSFDIVCSLGMFEYVADPRAILENMVWHLKPGGTLFIDIQHSSRLYDPVRWLRWRTGRKTGGSRLLFTKTEVRSLFQSLGLVDVQVSMREYPLLGDLYARHDWQWAFGIRNWLAKHPLFDSLGLVCFVFGTKPKS